MRVSVSSFSFEQRYCKKQRTRVHPAGYLSYSFIIQIDEEAPSWSPCEFSVIEVDSQNYMHANYFSSLVYSRSKSLFLSIS